MRPILLLLLPALLLLLLLPLQMPPDNVPNLVCIRDLGRHRRPFGLIRQHVRSANHQLGRDGDFSLFEHIAGDRGGIDRSAESELECLLGHVLNLFLKFRFLSVVFTINLLVVRRVSLLASLWYIPSNCRFGTRVILPRL